MKRRNKGLQTAAMVAGVALLAVMARSLVPELVRYARIKTM